ncbi:hypothetical protein CAPTEDRAFT_186833 [Capitella teleta]|uniref:Uncharacterized protein n=1 Tax=Capitella teleta TaxID=283909 RepID=R7UDD8_CAPTE|nr:hypothetical protein CAPTEDRAFT_186833 [Capitella teleta]|eukprot:ELU03979.1 hypothetical protein CAPTEDRAFT_186833 [Capitella teleta]
MKIFKSTAKFIRKRVGFKVTLTTRQLRKPSEPVMTRFRTVNTLTKEFIPEHLSPITKETVHVPTKSTPEEEADAGQEHLSAITEEAVHVPETSTPEEDAEQGQEHLSAITEEAVHVPTKSTPEEDAEQGQEHLSAITEEVVHVPEASTHEEEAEPGDAHLSPITEEAVHMPEKSTPEEDAELGQEYPVAMNTTGACCSPQSPDALPSLPYCCSRSPYCPFVCRLSPYCRPRFRPSKSLPTLNLKRRLPNPRRLRREVAYCRSLARRQQISETMTRGRLMDNVQERIREQREDAETCSPME